MKIWGIAKAYLRQWFHGIEIAEIAPGLFQSSAIRWPWDKEKVKAKGIDVVIDLSGQFGLGSLQYGSRVSHPRQQGEGGVYRTIRPSGFGRSPERHGGRTQKPEEAGRGEDEGGDRYVESPDRCPQGGSRKVKEEAMSQIKVTEKQIDEIMEKTDFQVEMMGDKTTVVMATLPNGFVIVESSSCVDPANYNHDLGVKLCKERIRDRLWMLEGYLLQSMVASKNAMIDNVRLANP